MGSLEPLKGFPKKIEAALEDGKLSYARKLFNDAKYRENVKNRSWDLIPVLTKYYNKETLDTKPEWFQCCEYLLDKLSELANPEEAVLQLVAEIEEAETDLKFMCLLEPVAKLICRIQTKRILAIIWVINAIEHYLEKCDYPDYENFDGKERLLVENSPVVSNVRKLYEEILSFQDTLSQFESDVEVKNMLIRFLVQILGLPLCFLHVELFGQVKTDGRILAERIVDKIFKLLSNPYEIELKQTVCQPDLLSTANLFYLIYGEGFGKVPQVYSGQFIFEKTLRFINALCETDNVILCEKGLKLAENVLMYLKGEKLSYFCLDNEQHKKFCLVLTNLVVYNSNELVRKRGLLVFTDYLKAFEVKGFYLIFMNLFDTLTHSGLKGHLITVYKNMLDQEYDNLSEYFKGTKLLNMLKKFCLIEVEDAFIIDHSNQIVSALNFLRYLISRDKNNKTLFWNYIGLIRKQFFEPLEKGIEMSRARFAGEIKNMDEGENNENIEMTVNVGTEMLQKFHKEEKLSSLDSYIIVIDLIESLLNRIKEILGN